MSKLLAILLELGKALDIPNEKIDALKALIENKKEEEISDADVLQILKDGHRAKLDVLSRNAQMDKKKSTDDAYKAAERKIKGELEAAIKEKLGLTDSVSETLDDLLDEAASKQASKGNKPGELNDEAVKKHPIYIALEKQHKADMAKVKTDSENALKKLQASYEEKETFGKVSKDALDIFMKMNPVLSADTAKAASQRELVTKLLNDYKYQEVDGVTIIMDKEGNVIEDELKNKLTLEAHVKKLTDPYFDFKKAEERNSPNGDNGGSGGTGAASGMKYTGALPKNKQELASMLYNETIPLEQRQELQKWSEENPNALTD